MENNIQTFHRKEIAKKQLETAIFLFLKEVDYASVITLAGAAGNILYQLVLNERKKPFIDLGRNLVHHFHGEQLPRKKYKRRMELLLGIPHLKHMSESCNDEIEIDLKESAVSTLIIAVTDYVTLFGQNEHFVKAFFQWCWVNKDGPGVIEFYNNLPEKLKK